MRSCFKRGVLGLSRRPFLLKQKRLDFLAGQVGIADHVTIGNGVKVGSKSGIDKDVPDGEIRFGYPALPGMQYHRASAVFKRLPELDKWVIALEKALTELNNNK